LGLTISRQLAEMMNGQIGVESEYGEGSTFWIQLNLVKSAVIPAVPSSIVDLVGKKVLIVDDNATNRHILRDQMLSWGCVPFEAKSGPSAIRMVAKGAYDLILMDLQMPDMDGQETGRRIRAIGGSNAAPMVLLSSACWQNSDIVGEFESVLSKPVRQSHLLETVIQLLSARQTPADGAQAWANLSGDALPYGLRILVAEDNRVNQMVVTHLLSKWNCHVTIAATGVEAIAHIEKEEFDLVLMDVQMPEMDGFEATKIIRQRRRQKRYVPILATTAHAMEGDKDRCLACGMDDYLTKPVKAEHLLRKLRHWTACPAQLAA
jgi:CheY-like chemotaxis protein